MNKLLIAFLIFLCGALPAFSGENGADSFQEIFENSQNGKVVIIDVREKGEIDEGMLPGAKWIPLSKIQSENNWDKEFKEIAGDNKKVYLYCRSGGRAEKVRQLLKDKGISAANLGGYESLSKQLPKKYK